MLDPREKYVSLVTFRKSGEPVATPVWFADLGGSFGVITETNVGKVKRIRNNPRVTITPCDMRGQLLDGAATYSASARIVSGGDAIRVRKAIRRKYPFAYRALSVLWIAGELLERLRRHPRETEVAIVFTLESTNGG